jgi:hypothetical protein
MPIIYHAHFIIYLYCTSLTSKHTYILSCLLHNKPVLYLAHFIPYLFFIFHFLTCLFFYIANFITNLFFTMLPSSYMYYSYTGPCSLRNIPIITVPCSLHNFYFVLKESTHFTPKNCLPNKLHICPEYNKFMYR